MENLSDAELAILMAHDPDLNKEEDSTGGVTGTRSAVSTPSSSATAAAEQEEKSPKDDQKKKRRPKKGFVMDQKVSTSVG